jgi:hypothetical protein
MEIVRFAVVALFKMKYITLIIGLLVVGCLIPEEKVVGTYAPFGSSSRRLVLLENGMVEGNEDGKERDEPYKKRDTVRNNLKFIKIISFI